MRELQRRPTEQQLQSLQIPLSWEQQLQSPISDDWFERFGLRKGLIAA
jgi:hypothetical protein